LIFYYLHICTCGQIWLNHFPDDSHLGYFTKLEKETLPSGGLTSGEPTHTGTSPTITWMFPGDCPLTCRQDKALSQARDKAQVGTYLKSESGNDPCLRTQSRQLISVGDESLAKQPQERHHGQRKRPKRPDIPL